MVDKLTPRLGLPEPFLTNPLKVDVGRLQQALEMIDANAVMLTDWDITADGWQKMGTIKGLAQGKIAASLMVVTGTGFANILFQTGDGTVTTVGDPARMTVSAQTSLGANAPTILGGRVVETAADQYEIWFNIAIGTSPRKWSGLLITGNGATIDWTHAMGTQPSDGVELQISRVLTSFDMASDTRTDIGTLLSTGHLGSGVVQLDYLTTVDLKGRLWKTGELVRIKKADATDDKGFPPALVSADPSATGWFIRCLSINNTRTVKEFEFTSESAGIIRAYKARLSGTTWSVAKVYTSLDKPTANDISALGMRAPVTGTVVVNLNDMYGPDYYGATAIKSTASAVAANNYPFDEVGTVLVLPFGDTFSCTQLYVTQSGRVAARSYDGSTWTTWRKQANSGVNDDITSMTGLTGPLKLGGDGVGDYDAVTMRQLRSSSGGAGGPSMNGVMNYGVGDFHLRDSRAFIQPYEVVSDGQLLNRADWPELWAYAQMLSPISDAEWLADAQNRGKYSTGDGSTTFRVPDRNGVQLNSIKGLFARGDGGGAAGQAGSISEAAAPNITGSFPGAIAGGYEESFNLYSSKRGLPGALGGENGLGLGRDGLQKSYSVLAPDNTYGFLFDASRADPVYGRYGIKGTIIPNSFIGVWVIRASGGFVAANTSWSVINGDTALPGNNTALKGGDLRSVYQIGGVEHMAVTLRAAGVVGGNYAPEIEQVSPSGGSAITKKWTFPQAQGELVSKAETGYTSINGKAGGTLSSAFGMSNCSASSFDSLYASNKNFGLYFEQMNVPGQGYLYPHSSFKLYWAGNYAGVFTWSAWANKSNPEYVLSWTTEATTTPHMWRFNGSNGNATATGSWVPTSDERLKNLHGPITDPLVKMQQIRGQTWNMKDGGAFGVGFTAQDVQRVFPDSVHSTGDKTLSDGTVVKDVLAPDTYGVAAGLHHEAILALLKRIEVLEAKLKDK